MSRNLLEPLVNRWFVRINYINSEKLVIIVLNTSQRRTDGME